MTLYEGLAKALAEFGSDILADERLVAVLADYRALRPEATRVILRAMLREGITEPLLTKYRRGDKDGESYLYAVAMRVAALGFDQPFARYVVASIGYALGWTAEAPAVPEFVYLADQGSGAESSHSQEGCAREASPLSLDILGIDYPMVQLPGAAFTMGASHEQSIYAAYDERPPVQTTVSAFAIGAIPVTQELWQRVMGENPSHMPCPQAPVERVSWDDCQEFLRRVRAVTFRPLRLPTEAEWEYAARGACLGPQTVYSGSDYASSCAWQNENAGGTTHPVGLLSPNVAGLYDMCGNVAEWCQDWYLRYYEGDRTDPKGPDTGSTRVVRGGSYNVLPQFCRVSSRNALKPFVRSRVVGLRIAMDI